MNVIINKEKHSKLELVITVTGAEFMKYWDKGFAAVQAEASIDGFRKGHAPQGAVVAKYGEMSILQEMADVAINDTYAKAIVEHKIKIISAPHVHIVSMGKDSDFVYHAHVDVMPEIILPDYKKIAADSIKEKKIIEDTNEDEIKTIMSELSNEVKTATPDIETKIRENLKSEKEYLENSRTRSIFLENLVKEVTEKNVDNLPENFDDKSKAQFAIFEISKLENIKPLDIEIESEVIKIMASMNPNEMKNAKLDENHIRAYAEQILVNEKVLSLLRL